MDIFETRYYRMNKYIVEVIGQWPYQSPRQQKFKSLFVFLIIGTVIIVQGLKAIQLWGVVDLMVECMVPAAGHVVGLIKSSNCIINSVKMRRLLDLIKKDWTSMTDEEEIKVLSRFVERGGFLGLIYGACMLGTVITFLIVSLMPQILDIIVPLNETRPRRLLDQVEYYVDMDDHYLLIVIHTYLALILTGTICVGADAMLVAYVHHTCGMFNIIGNRIENTMKDAEIDANFHAIAGRDKVYDHIANCVKDHGKAIEFARLIESSYSMAFVFEIGVSMLMICSTGLQVIVNFNKYVEAIKFSQCVIGQLAHLLFISWTGQMLIDHTNLFRRSLYFAEWHRFPLGGRHLIRLAMLRTLKPCKITAGKIYDMSMESFAKVLQTSMSYFMVLVSLR